MLLVATKRPRSESYLVALVAVRRLAMENRLRVTDLVLYETV
jgi:hypothetical protein